MAGQLLMLVMACAVVRSQTSQQMQCECNSFKGLGLGRIILISGPDGAEGVSAASRHLGQYH